MKKESLIDEKEDQLEQYVESLAQDYIETDIEKAWFREITQYPLLTDEEEKQCGRDLKKKDNLTILDKNNHINLNVLFLNLEGNPYTEEVLKVLQEMYSNLQEASLDKEWKKVEEYLEQYKRLGRPLTKEEVINLLHMKKSTQKIDKEDLLEQVQNFACYNRAKYKMIRANYRLVIKPARRYAYSTSTEFLDLANEGTIGLIKAVDRFDVNKGFRFSTYALWWIRQSITKHLGENTSSLNITTSEYKEVKEFKEGVKNLEKESGKTFSAEEISKLFGMPYSEVVNILYYNPYPVSLETPIGDEEDSTLGSMIPDQETDFEENIFLEELRSVLNHTFALLKPEEELVMRLITGLNEEGRVYTDYEVAKKLKKTRGRIQTIESNAFKKIRLFAKRDEKAKQLAYYL